MAQKKDISDELTRLRNQIDKIDPQILALVNQRLEIGKKIGELKKQSGSKVLDLNREKKIIEKITGGNNGPAKKELVQYLFNTIIHATREIQKPQTISFLGPQASYTHMAALSHFNHSGLFIEQVNLYDIFRDVERNQSHFGVVPVENSIEGAVNHTLDLFSRFDLHICAEHYESISHTLLSLTGDLKDVQQIYSHPQALAQCRGWIKKNHPNAELVETNSTSKAAVLAMENKSIGAIASRQAAKIYDLETVESGIEDNSGNTTRFLVIGKEMPEPTGNDKTSIMFATTHVPGALFKTLEPVDKAGLNMLKLESRPTRDHNWSYYFFMDIEGHHKDKKVSQTIEEIKNLSLSLKILGSYPVFSNLENNVAL